MMLKMNLVIDKQKIPYPLKNPISDELIHHFEGNPTTYKLIKLAIHQLSNAFYAQVYQPNQKVDLTSCIHTNLAINQVFLNRQQFDCFKVISRLRLKSRLDFKEKCLAIDLFLGAAILKVPINYVCQEYIRQVEKESKNLITEFCVKHHITRQTSSEKLIWKSIKEDFNLTTFQSFKKEIKAPIEPNSSYIYNISSREADHLPHSVIFFHAFAIEKFLGQNNTLCFRVYESWVDQFTLAECFIGRGYSQGDHGEGCIQENQIEKYLEKLEKVFCRSAHSPAPKHVSEKHILDAFGYKCLNNFISDHETRYLDYNHENQIVRGLTFSYTRWKISHQSSLHNFAHLIENNEQLKKRWEEIRDEEPPRKKIKISNL